MDGVIMVLLIAVLSLQPSFMDFVAIDCGSALTNQSPIDLEELKSVPANQTYSTNASIPILFDLGYDNVSGIPRAGTFNQGMGQVCFFKSALGSTTDIPAGSNVSMIIFTAPFLRNVTVVSPYNQDRHTVRVQFDTTWRDIEGDFDTFTTSVMEGKLINISYFTYLLPYQPIQQAFNEPPTEVKDCDFEIDSDWCLTPFTSTQHLGTTPRRLPSGQCVIPFVLQMDKYKEMWIPSGYPSQEFNKRCFLHRSVINGSASSPEHRLHDRYGYNNVLNWVLYQQNFLHEGSVGSTVQLKVGRNNLVDINITMDLQQWDIEFYQYFIDMYRDKDVKYGFQNRVNYMQYNMTNLTIFYFIPPAPPVRKKTIPFYTWIFLALAAVPAFTLVVACVLIISTRSLGGFNPEIWKLWISTQKAANRMQTMQQGLSS